MTASSLRRVAVSSIFVALALAVFATAATGSPRRVNAASPAAHAGFTFKTFDVPNSVYTDVLGINNLGVMVGNYIDNSYVGHGFIVSRGQITTVDVPGAAYTLLQSINDWGTAVGWWASATDGSVHGFIRSWSGAITTLDDPNATQDVGPLTFAYGINNAGVVVGQYMTSFEGGCCTAYGFQYKNGTFSTISVPGEDDTAVYGINNFGGISGITAIHFASWQGFTGSTHLPGGAYSVFTGLGDNGEGTYPQAINDWGTVVGHSNNTVFVGWERLANGQMTTITDPLANNNPNLVPDGGFGGTAPGGINDLGTVVGVYFDTSGYGQGFIATPTR